MRSLLLTLLMLATLPASGAQWQVYTHSVGNQAGMVDGMLRGLPHGGKRAFYVELVRALLKDLEQPEQIVEVPLARGLKLVQSRPHVVLFNLSRTPDREHLVHWVGPTLEETDYLYEMKERPTGIRSLADAIPLPVCVLNGSSHDSLLTEHGFTDLQRANSYAGCFRMLDAGRVWLVASADTDLDRKLEEAQIGTTEVVSSAVSLGEDRGYIALSKETPLAEVRRWQAARRQMIRDGRYKRLYAEFAR